MLQCLSAVALLLGVCLLTAIGVAARPSRAPAASSTRRALGAMLVAVPLPLALALHLLARPAAPLDQAAFVVGVVAFGVGVFLVLPWSAEDERSRPEDDPDPGPWWPAFEREFRSYSRRSREVRA